MKEKASEYIKNNWKNILLVLAYIIIASLVYGFWFESLWHLWYINLIAIIAIIAIGVALGYFYIKSENKKIEDKEKAN